MYNIKNITVPEDMFTLHGSMKKPVGEVKVIDGGLFYEGEGYEVTSKYTTHPSGVTERRDCIKNVSDEDISICSILSKFVFNGGEYEVYTQYSEWCGERNGAWQPLVSEVSASNDDVRQNAGSVPFVAINNLQNGRGYAFHIMCDSTWRLRVRKVYAQTGQRKYVSVELGIDDKNFNYTLKSGETLELPAILFYEFRNKLDMDAYKLHRYCNEKYPARSFPVIYNSWMSKFDNISFDILSEQLEVAKKIGAEYFVIDAGWFGKPNVWFESVGDWVECTEDSMRGRMKDFADKVRSLGLKFGLWFEIERAAMTAKSVAEHPEHYITENGQCFVNFGKEDTCEYILGVISEQIEKYGIEFIKFDFNAELTYDSERLSFLNYFKGYRKFIKELGERFPSLYLQNCASGGLRMALANLDGFDSFWMSDDHSLYSQLEIFKTTLVRMPPRALEKWMTIRSLAPFEPLYGGGVTEKILVSGDSGWGHMEAVNDGFMKAVAVGGPLGISCDLTKLSDKVVETLTEFIADYKAEKDFWIATECHILCDTPTLLAIQYNDAKMDTVKVFTYAKIPSQKFVTLYPEVDMDDDYLVGEEKLGGADIDADGVELKIAGRFAANTVTLKKVK